MIERLEHAKTWGSRVIAALAIVAAVSKDHVFELAMPPTATTAPTQQQPASNASGTPAVQAVGGGSTFTQEALYIAAIIFLYAVLETAMDMSIVRSRAMRKFAMGNKDVEDYWVDIVFQSDKIIGGGLIQIRFDKGDYKIAGTDFDTDRIWRGWFETDVSAYSDSNLSFKYRALRPGKLDDGTGHGEYNFMSGRGGRLSHYFGHFYEDRDNKRFYVYGERLSVYLHDKKQRQLALHPARMPGVVAAFIRDRRIVLPIVENDVRNVQGVLPFPNTSRATN